MDNFTVEEVRELLRTNVLEITFTKVNGDMRVMKCSTNPLYIPEDLNPAMPGNEKPAVEPNPNILKVVDVDLGQWRSIRFDSIERIASTGDTVLVQSPAEVTV